MTSEADRESADHADHRGRALRLQSELTADLEEAAQENPPYVELPRDARVAAADR